MKTKNVQAKIYSTTDLGLACSLETLGFLSVGFKGISSKQVLFCFKDSAALQKAVISYWNDIASVSPRRYFENLKSIKNRLHSLLRQHDQ